MAAKAIRGTRNNDTINGTDGNDIIYALSGNDLVFAGSGNDIVDGGAGDDTIDCGLGNDLLFGGLGNDIVTGVDGSNTVYGGTGNDNIALAGFGVNVIYGDGHDSFRLQGGNVVPTALATSLGADTINGGSGSDTIYGDNGNNLSGSGGGGADVIHGNDGADIIYGEGGNDQLFGGAGNDQLLGGAGDDTLVGDANNDTLTGGAGNDLLNGGENPAGVLGDRDRVSYAVNDDISGATGVNVNLATGIALDGLGGTDTLVNIEEITGTNFDDTLTGGNQTNFDTRRAEQFEGRGGNDIITGGIDGNRANYTDAPDGIVVNLSTSAIDLGGGDFIAAGTARDGYGTVDTLVNINRIGGSAHDDLIYGGNSDNNERFEGRAGADTIHGGVGIDYLHYQNSLQAVTVNLGFTGSGVVANDGFGTADTFTGIEGVRGSAFADVLTGSDRTDQVERYEGMGGDDTITGGLGNDRVEFFQSPTSVIVNLSAAAVTVGGVTVDPNRAMDGFGGIDTLSGIERAAGSEFNDTFIGGAEANHFFGEGGDDTLLGGDGNDQLFGGAGFDSLDGGNGIDRADYSDAPSAVAVDLANGSASNDGFGTTDTLISIEQVTGSEFNDTLIGGAGNNEIHGFDGNDEIIGGDGDDLIFADNGNDSLTGGDGNDLIFADNGDDSLTGGNGDDSIRGGDGNDSLTGGDGTDDLRGHAGFDLLVGGAGGDTFRWGAGDQGTVALPAIDTISDFDLVANSDKLDLRDLLQGETAGTLANYLQFTSDGTDTTIEVKSQGLLGGVDQEIVLVGVNLTGTDSDIISSLILNGNLFTD